MLESEELEDISLELLKEIIKRDALQLSSELTVLEAVNRWSQRNCQRRHLAVTDENKRAVLGGAQGGEPE